MALCPSCHTEIGIWSDDPLKTPKGLLNGEEYEGFVHPKVVHISEIQTARNLKEQELGISITNFTPVNPLTNEITKKHINELRLSTEKILIASSNVPSSRNDLLYRYFNYDVDGNYIGTTKNEWTDVYTDLTGVRTSYTILPSDQESLFQTDYSNYATQYGVNPDPDAEEHYYDYRGLWQDTGGIVPDAEGHLPSLYKLVGHPNLIVDGINTVTGKEVEPNMPIGYGFFIKGVHIEDLRHPIPLSEDLEYPGTGFLRRYITLDLISVYTTFNDVPSGDSILVSLSDKGGNIQFASNFIVKNTENYTINYPTEYISGTPSSMLCSPTSYPGKIGFSIQTDGKYLYHWWYIDENEERIDKWELSEESSLYVEVWDGAIGEWVWIWIEPIDSEKASASWDSYYIHYVWQEKVTPGFTEFAFCPQPWQNYIPYPPIYPAPSWIFEGYECIKIGNATPEDYKIGYKRRFGEDYVGDYIGSEWVIVGDYPYGDYKKFCNRAYSGRGIVPIIAIYKYGSKILTYTCNIS